MLNLFVEMPFLAQGQFRLFQGWDFSVGDKHHTVELVGVMDGLLLFVCILKFAYLTNLCLSWVILFKKFTSIISASVIFRSIK